MKGNETNVAAVFSSSWKYRSRLHLTRAGAGAPLRPPRLRTFWSRSRDGLQTTGKARSRHELPMTLRSRTGRDPSASAGQGRIAAAAPGRRLLTLIEPGRRVYRRGRNPSELAAPGAGHA